MGAIDSTGEQAAIRVTLYVSEADCAFLDALAEYRNALAKAQGKNLRKQWSRKMIAESFLSTQCSVMREQLRAMFEAVGPFPAVQSTDNTEADKKANAKRFGDYAKSVLEWDAGLSD